MVQIGLRVFELHDHQIFDTHETHTDTKILVKFFQLSGRIGHF